MTTKERSYLMDELGDPDAPIGSRLWCLYVSNEIRKTYYDKTQLGTRLKNLVESFTEHQGWQELGFLSWDKFCEARLHIAAEKLESEARSRVVEVAGKAIPLSSNGGDRKNQYNNCNTERQGNDNEYLTARIARDHPAILEDMKQGKYKSVRAAAIDAGIVDPEKTRRFQLPTDPVAAGRYLAYRVDKDWLMECVDAYFKEENHEKDT